MYFDERMNVFQTDVNVLVYRRLSHGGHPSMNYASIATGSHYNS